MSDTFPDLTKPDVAPATFDLDAWIDGSKPTERSVTLVGRGDLVAEAEAVMRRLDVVRQIPESDRGVNDDSEAALEARAKQLYDEMEASRSTWYLRALPPEELKAANAAAEKDDQVDQAAHLLSAAVTKVVMPDGATVTRVTPAQVVKLRAKLGHQEVMRLMATLTLAMSEEPAIQAPFSRTSSEGPAGTE